ncbi:MAG: SAM-dependent methyltransferase [Lachnospiraceae bacterium]|nr:SAM-dependent methyltransferase [Lachnospiraceae bacterium]
MKEVSLSRRLETIAGMVTPGSLPADVGCDHAHIPIWLIQKGRVTRVIAMDVAEGPLKMAAMNLEEYDAEGVELRQSDGLEKLEAGEADTLIIAGMGGALTRRILERDPEKVRSFDEIILGPQSEIPLLRKWLRESGFAFAEEKLVPEDGKYYPVMKLLPPGKEGRSAAGNKSAFCPDDLADWFGCRLLEKKDPVLIRMLERNRRLLTGILEGLDPDRHLDRIAEIRQELDRIRRAMEYMQ